MTDFFMTVHSELLKLWYSKSTKIIALLVLGAQGGLAYISSKQILAVGLDATPETCKDLIEAMPPLEYMGFDAAFFGTIPMIVLGAIYGSGEFKQHCMRTTMLSAGKRSRIFTAKLLTVTIVSFILSLASIIVTITITHAAFDEQGLKPLVFNRVVWRFIILAAVGWTLLTMVSYMTGFLFRTAVVPLLFLIVQAYSIGNLLAEHFTFGRYLPVSLVNRLIASSESMLSSNPLTNISILILWIAGLGVIAFFRFCRSDLKGEY